MRCFTGRMDYTFVPSPPKANSGWMAHHLKLWVKPDRHQEFLDYLSTYCGKKHIDWRVESRSKDAFWIWGYDPMKVRFKSKKHAALVKLQWIEDEDPRPDLSNILKHFQSIGRGIRNVPMVSIPTWKPPSNSTPWIYDIETLSQDRWDNIYFNKPISEPKLYWHKSRHRAMGNKIMTTEELEEKLDGTRPEQTKVCWDPETLYLRDGFLFDAGEEERSGDGSSDV